MSPLPNYYSRCCCAFILIFCFIVAYFVARSVHNRFGITRVVAGDWHTIRKIISRVCELYYTNFQFTLSTTTDYIHAIFSHRVSVYSFFVCASSRCRLQECVRRVNRRRHSPEITILNTLYYKLQNSYEIQKKKWQRNQSQACTAHNMFNLESYENNNNNENGIKSDNKHHVNYSTTIMYTNVKWAMSKRKRDMIAVVYIVWCIGTWRLCVCVWHRNTPTKTPQQYVNPRQRGKRGGSKSFRLMKSLNEIYHFRRDDSRATVIYSRLSRHSTWSFTHWKEKYVVVDFTTQFD